MMCRVEFFFHQRQSKLYQEMFIVPYFVEQSFFSQIYFYNFLYKVLKLVAYKGKPT